MIGIVAGVSAERTDELNRQASQALADLAGVATSEGAPSARNLLSTVFGDALLPHGDDVAVSVRSLAVLLEALGPNERLIRTSLTRLVNERLLQPRSEGRRAFYQVAPWALRLFARADRRIYGTLRPNWDGAWTVVIIDGAESTPALRAALRQELGWAGLGTVAPNVMASPVVEPVEATATIERIGGIEGVLVTRSALVPAVGTMSAEALARRVANLDEVGAEYQAFVDFFGRFDLASLTSLDARSAFKLRTLLVSNYRRIVLADPLLPVELLPADWIGDVARRVVAEVYAGCIEQAEGFLVESAELPGAMSPLVARPQPGRFEIE